MYFIMRSLFWQQEEGNNPPCGFLDEQQGSDRAYTHGSGPKQDPQGPAVSWPPQKHRARPRQENANMAAGRHG